LEAVVSIYGHIENDELVKLFRSSIDQLAEAFATFDFIELNQTNVIYHL
jgi:hypothetical protein